MIRSRYLRRLPVLGGPKAVPLSISGLALWLDSSDASSVTLDGSNNVSQWNDKSGNARHAAQSTALNRPSWLTNQIGSYGAVKPNGSSQWLEVPSMPSMAAGWTVLLVVRRGTVESRGIVGANAGTASSALIIGPGTGTNLQISQWGSSLNVTGPSLGSGVDFGILATYDGSHTTGNFSIRVSTNGTPATGTMTQSAGTPPSATWNIGRYGSAGGYFGSNIYEIIAYDRQISVDEQTQLRTFSTSKWGLAWS